MQVYSVFLGNSVFLVSLLKSSKVSKFPYGPNKNGVKKFKSPKLSKCLNHKKKLKKVVFLTLEADAKSQILMDLKKITSSFTILN